MRKSVPPKIPATLAQRVAHFVREQRLVPGRQKLVVAVSGGPDSVCMLHVLNRLREELGIELHVAHLNHQMRGTEADADARYVSELAQKLGIPATIEQRDVPAYQAQHHISLEEAAREVRYKFLSQVAVLIGAKRVAAGHTLDDHVETILMHLIRGSGTRGLRGLQPISQRQAADGKLTVIRPLLQVSRQETNDYCTQHRLEPRTDTTNLSLSSLRNRIRHQLIPLLQSYNPQVVPALLRTARIASDDLAFLDEEIARLWNKTVEQRESVIILDKKRLLELPAALKRHLLRTCIENLLGNLMDIETRHIEDMMKVLNKPAGKRIDLPEGLTFTVEYDKYLLSFGTGALCPFPELETEFTLNIPGETRIPGWHIEAEITDTPKGKAPDDFIACFDFDRTGNKLKVRRRQPGDRFQPLGMSQPKKLNEFMIDAKISQSWRQRVPVVCSPEHILWVVGWRIDDRAKVSDATQTMLHLRFERG